MLSDDQSAPTPAPKTLSPVEAAKARAFELLSELGGSTTGEDDIVFSGKKMVLPETYNGDLRAVAKFIMQKWEEEEREYAYSHTFKFRPLDGAVATGRVIKNIYGMTLGAAVKTMFGEEPPQLIDVQVSVDETIQAPWGAMKVPGMPGLTLHLDNIRDADLGNVFYLHGEGPRKYRHAVAGLFKAIERELETNSIYRGKAITGQAKPNFLDLSSIDPDSVVYNADVLAQLKANVWTPIERADDLVALGEPTKRAVLFSGPFGTGKTMGAYLTALRAVANGWTFLMARPGRDNLEHVIQTARMYQPAVVFTEDVDTFASTDKGADHVSKVLDLFDGLDTKGLRMMLVLTTNNVDSLHPGMLRPGRLDAIVTIADLDVAGVEKLARIVLGDRLAADIDWDKVFQATQGYTPAFIREVFGRVHLYQLSEDRTDTVTTDDLVHSANGLRYQYDVMVKAMTPEPEVPSIDDALGRAVRKAVDGVGVVDSDDDTMYELRAEAKGLDGL